MLMKSTAVTHSGIRQSDNKSGPPVQRRTSLRKELLTELTRKLQHVKIVKQGCLGTHLYSDNSYLIE